MNTSPLGKLDVTTFLDQYWQKQPLLIRNALANVASPLTADELAGLACEAQVESRLITRVDDEWALQHGPFNEQLFLQLPTSPWTLLVQAVDHYIPAAAELLQRFDFIPRWRIDDLMVSYANKGGGVGPHYDNYDVFLVQTQGQREWQIGGHYDDNSLLLDHLPVKIVADFQVQQSYLLAPGDILYVPPGVGHNGIAQSDNCMTCSVGFRAPSYNDILREYTDYLGDHLAESIRYSDADLKPQEHSGEINTAVFTRLQSILHEQLLDEHTLQDWFGRYATMPKYTHDSDDTASLPHTRYSLDNIKAHFSNGGSLNKNENSRFAFIRQPEQHILFVDGDRIASDNSCTHLIEQLCDQSGLCAHDFTHSDENLNLLLTLLEQEALYLN